MTTTIIDDKGRIQIPERIRKELSLKSREEFEIKKEGKKITLLPLISPEEFIERRGDKKWKQDHFSKRDKRYLGDALMTMIDSNRWIYYFEEIEIFRVIDSVPEKDELDGGETKK